MGQLLGLLVAGLLFALHAGADLTVLAPPLDLACLLVLISWLLALVAFVWLSPRCQEGNPSTLMLVMSAPVLTGLASACMMPGLIPLAAQPLVGCQLLLQGAFWSERAVFLGMLATATLYWGALAVLLPRLGQRSGRRTLGMAFAALLLLAGAAIWTFLDPAMPSRARVGGFEMRGIWFLFLAAPVFWMWALLVPAIADAKAGSRALTSALAACVGLLLAGSAMVAYHRARGLFALIHPAEGELDLSRIDTGVVVATALLRAGSFVLVAVLAAVLAGLLRRDPAERRRQLSVLVTLAAILGLDLGYEGQWRENYAVHCDGLVPAGIELPVAMNLEPTQDGPILMVGTQSAFLEGRELSGTEADFPSAGSGDAELQIGADRGVTFSRLAAFLQQAGVAGFSRFRLILRPSAEDPCRRERRLFGVCLTRHFSRLGGIPFQIPHFEQTPRPLEGVVANIVAESDRIEVSFGGFQTAPEVLDRMGMELPDRLGVRDLDGLERVLQEARELFPQSRTAILVIDDTVSGEELAGLMRRVRGEEPEFLFPLLTVSRLVR